MGFWMVKTSAKQLYCKLSFIFSEKIKRMLNDHGGRPTAAESPPSMADAQVCFLSV